MFLPAWSPSLFHRPRTRKLRGVPRPGLSNSSGPAYFLPAKAANRQSHRCAGSRSRIVRAECVSDRMPEVAHNDLRALCRTAEPSPPFDGGLTRPAGGGQGNRGGDSVCAGSPVQFQVPLPQTVPCRLIAIAKSLCSEGATLQPTRPQGAATRHGTQRAAATQELPQQNGLHPTTSVVLLGSPAQEFALKEPSIR